MTNSSFIALYKKLSVDPIVDVLCKVGITPNVVTLLACLSGVAAAPYIAFRHPYLAIVFILLSGHLDFLDGALARRLQRSSSAGAVYDIVSDRIVEFSIIMGLFFVDPSSRGIMSMFMLGSILVCVTSFLVVGIFTDNESEKGFYYSPGIMERGEAFAFFVVMILIPSLFTVLAIVFTVLVFLTASIRLYQFSRAV
ncbi:MAG: CDP-alcohol phosphatidyltransferase family protein [Waddliaceae bacterium]|jgi:archaetidylinositol phosphate synthase|nr:CDP-alcohol phosphatidyltransferase family protein [Waddliaceae bacterium]MBT3578759.1 CDP-alcohol phosphatidyltransferase family protein [Waddliaceae bacterium]MBT4444407.1 CDP-alcohol phosphatidyltransferase family protein [Waddliaceae bacterium]MBT6927881.1 CDP-alcohol phosphatidyltransferase family protein [Waddliaceae bacterium]MBT7265217.1 CDP-alcohol phosphatidyltransferase family protein [Waddliaceae bacterium]